MLATGTAQAATTPAIPVIRYTVQQPTCPAREAGTVGVVAGDGWHMFPARCSADGGIHVWDALPVPHGTYAGDNRVCAALAAFNRAGIPSARQLGTLAWDGLTATGDYRHDDGWLLRDLVDGRPFGHPDWRLVLDCHPDW